jgi:LysM repeat protein
MKIKMQIKIVLILLSSGLFTNISGQTIDNDSVSSSLHYVSLPDSLINFGTTYLKTRYRYGGMSEKGFDCSGFTSFVYRNFGYQLPRSSAGQAQKFLGVEKDDIQRGDLVFFNGRRQSGKRVGHVGIVTEVNEDGSFNFIHSSVARGVVISNSAERYYNKRYVGTGRVFGDGENLLATRENAAQNSEKGDALSNSQNNDNLNIKTDNNNIVVENPEYHIVSAGETLYSVARQHKISQQDLKDYNGLTGSKLYAGQKLIVGEQQLTAQEITEIALSEQTPEEQTEKCLYTVQKGDTLYSISKIYGCTVVQLREWNHKENNELKIGEEILVYN